MSLFRIREALALVALVSLRLLVVTAGVAGACLLVFGRPMWQHLLSG